VAITFWTFAGLYVVLGPPVARSMPFPRTWWPTALLVAVFTFGTWSVGVAKLRPPFRAQDNGVPYSYGFNPPEPDGRGGLQQWARQRAVTVVEAPKPSLRLAISVNHHDLAERPVHAKVWVNGALAMDTYLSTTQTVSKDISLDPARTHVAIETWVDRVVMPRDVGVNDGRELGLLVAWSGGTSP
jgi:hypothetical protein